VGTLAGGGTFVAYVAPAPSGSAARDWTLVVEKIRDETGPCLRDDYKNNSIVAEEITFAIGGDLARGAIQTWRSDWSAGKGIEALFQPGPVLTPRKDTAGRVTVTLKVGTDQVVTASSLPRATHGRRGEAHTPPPASAPFPATYANDFQGEALDSEDLYFSDQAGKWEVRVDGDDPSNRVLSQVSPEIGVVYRGDTRPISVLGDTAWRNAQASLRFRLEDANTQGFWLSLRTLNAGTNSSQGGLLPQGTNIAGLYLVLQLDGAWRLASSTVGEGWFNESIASGRGAALRLRQWYNLSMAVAEQRLDWSLQGAAAAEPMSHTLQLADDTFPPAGQLGMGLVGYGLASVDDLRVSGARG